MRMPEVELVAVCDINPARTSACARLFGAPEQYLDYFDMLKRADIEAVFILTGPGPQPGSPWPPPKRASTSCCRNRWPEP